MAVYILSEFRFCYVVLQWYDYHVMFPLGAFFSMGGGRRIAASYPMLKLPKKKTSTSTLTTLKFYYEILHLAVT